MSDWNSGWWKTLLLPGGLTFALASLLLFSGVVRISPAALSFYYSAIFLGGLALAWRFHSGRTLAGILLLLLAHRAIEFFAAGHSPLVGPGRTALEAVSFFLALNFVWLAASGEFAFTVLAFGPRLGVLFFESVFVAIICRPSPAWGSDLFRSVWLPPAWFSWTRLSQVPSFALMLAFAFLVVRSMSTRKQVDAGLAWALAAAACALSAGGVGRVADGFFATAGLVLLVSVVEASYRMAYHDELTGIPGRRAFNDACTDLELPYTVAIVDIDHFKQFNDTHGHDTGDEVLRMVAGRLAGVTGGGKAFRVGGEEFAILFKAKATEDVALHLEQLRRTVEATAFHVRGTDRRLVARGPERRHSSRTSGQRKTTLRAPQTTDLTVTVSIGAAGSREAFNVEDAIARADKALYRAKKNGRNRLEVDGKRSQERPKGNRSRKPRAKTA